MASVVAEHGVTYMQSFPQRLLPANRRVRTLLRETAIGPISLVRKRHGHYFALRELAETMPWISGSGAGRGRSIPGRGRPSDRHASLALGRPVRGGGPALTDFRRQIGGGYRRSDLSIPRRGDGRLGGRLDLGGRRTHHRDLRRPRHHRAGVHRLRLLRRPLPEATYLRLYRADCPKPAWTDLGDPDDFWTIHQRVPRAFLDCLIAGQPPTSGLADGAAALEMILGAYQAAAERRSRRLSPCRRAFCAPGMPPRRRTSWSRIPVRPRAHTGSPP